MRIKAFLVAGLLLSCSMAARADGLNYLLTTRDDTVQFDISSTPGSLTVNNIPVTVNGTTLPLTVQFAQYSFGNEIDFGGFSVEVTGILFTGSPTSPTLQTGTFPVPFAIDAQGFYESGTLVVSSISPTAATP